MFKIGQRVKVTYNKPFYEDETPNFEGTIVYIDNRLPFPYIVQKDDAEWEECPCLEGELTAI